MATKLGCVVTVVFALASANAYGQTWDRQLTTVGMSRSSSSVKTLRCGWLFWWNPVDAYAGVHTWVTLTSNGRQFHSYGSGVAGVASLETSLNGTYLPSITFRCGSDGWIQWPGYVGYYELYEPEFQWENDECNGWAPLYHAIRPTTGYAVSAEVYAWSTTAYYAVGSGAEYWGNVGSDLSYPELRTVPGGDVTFYPSWDLDPDEPASYSPSMGTISLNANISYSYDQWALVIAHEFGHSVGLHHTTAGGIETSLMLQEVGGETGLQTRQLDKCSIVRHYPVNLQIS